LKSLFILRSCNNLSSLLYILFGRLFNTKSSLISNPSFNYLYTSDIISSDPTLTVYTLLLYLTLTVIYFRFSSCPFFFIIFSTLELITLSCFFSTWVVWSISTLPNYSLPILSLTLIICPFFMTCFGNLFNNSSTLIIPQFYLVLISVINSTSAASYSLEV